MGISEKEKVRAEKIRIRISKINWIFNVFSVKNQLNDYFNFNHLKFINFFMVISINILFYSVNLHKNLLFFRFSVSGHLVEKHIFKVVVDLIVFQRIITPIFVAYFFH